MAVSVGGTFAEVCILDDATKELRVEKTASTADPLDGILGSVTQAGVDLSQVAPPT